MNINNFIAIIIWVFYARGVYLYQNRTETIYICIDSPDVLHLTCVFWLISARRVLIPSTWHSFLVITASRRFSPASETFTSFSLTKSAPFSSSSNIVCSLSCLFSCSMKRSTLASSFCAPASCASCNQPFRSILTVLSLRICNLVWSCGDNYMMKWSNFVYSSGLECFSVLWPETTNNLLKLQSID